jgi:BirA family biotin operon repressor/biotin-[acetyl-CoA-carboxylase] ligase
MDAGLYLSIVLRPRIEQRLLPLITLLAGVAVHDALAELGLKPDIKWVNDLLVNEKKIAGILAEAIETERGIVVILGIGINLTAANFPVDIAGSATSIEAETGHNIAADALTRSVIRHLIDKYDDLHLEFGPERIIEHWRRRSTYFTDKRVRVTLDGRSFDGTTEGLEDNGALRVRTINGSVKVVQAGDVERLRTDKHQ